jgi:3'-phosphoadenosine 5'-phosphosulfate sulfotransferase (PAPS reductase)/FAD synthetase
VIATQEQRATALEAVRGRLVVASVSGGKDSAAMSLHLAELGIEHRRVFLDTGWEHPLSYHYVLRRPEARAAIARVRPRWTEEEVELFLDRQDAALGEAPLQRALGPIEVLRGERQMADLIRAKGMFPSRVRRFCTEELKVEPMVAHLRVLMDEGRAVVNAIGIRHGESAARALTLEWDSSGRFGCDVWSPLTRWTLDDVIAIHRRHDLRPNPLYLLGASRVGCWPCIFARKAELRLIADTDPEQIDTLRDLEAEIATKARARYERDRALWLTCPDPEPDPAEAKAHKRWQQKRDRLMRPFVPPAWFQSWGASQRAPGDPGGWEEEFCAPLPIDAAVDWSRTAFGGRQFEMFAPTSADTGCVRWGLCDTGAAEDRQ